MTIIINLITTEKNDAEQIQSAKKIIFTHIIVKCKKWNES